MLDKIKNFLGSIRLRDIIFILIIIILCMCLTWSIRSCREKKIEYKTNIIAAHDTLHHYISKGGDTVTYIQGYAGEIEDLKIMNKKMYDELQDMKLKPKETQTVIYTDGQVVREEVVDTVYEISHDTINNGFNRKFEFNDEWRELEGTVDYHNDSLGVSIDKDVVNFDYTLAIDKDYKVYLKSNNPYVRTNELSSITLPKPKKTHWSIGPSIQYNYDPFGNKHGVGIGVSLQYNLIKW